MINRQWMSIRTSLLVLAGSLLLCRPCPGQMMIRNISGKAPAGDGTELLFVPAQTDTAAPSPTETAPTLQCKQDGVRVDTTDVLQEYEMKAGSLGPRKWFSATKFESYFRLGVTFDDNILLSSTGPKRSDVITTVVGGVRFLLGDFADRVHTYAVLGYAGTENLFAHYSEENSYDQDAVLELYYRPHQIALGSTSIFQERHDATVDVGQRVDRRIYGEDFTARYFRNDLTTFSLALHYEYDDYDTPVDTSNLTMNPAVDYHVTSKATVGAGAVLGWLTATGGVEEYSGEAQFRLGYAVTHKIAATGSVGVEYRERSGGASDSITPVFGLTGKWTPTDGTTISLEGFRRTEASGALKGDDFVSTGVRFAARQDLFRRIYVRLDVGYQNADYRNVSAEDDVPRNDNYFSVRGTVGYDFVRWLQILAFYEHQEDVSTRSSFAFTSNRVGLELGLTY